MVSNQIALQKLLSEKTKDLNSLLKQRGIPLPSVSKPHEDVEEKKLECDPEIESDEANAAMMAAALAALRH